MKKVRVLITDDSNLMRKLLSNIVAKDSRLEVIGTAENGKDCLEKIKSLQPDVVTLDMNMPVMDGLTCLKEAQSQNLRPAFLVVSSLAQKDAQITIDAINAGALDYIPKPSQMLGIGSLEKEIISKIVMVHEARQEALKSEQKTSAAPAPTPPGRQAPPAVTRPATPAVATASSSTAAPAGVEAAAAAKAAGKPKLTIFGGSSGSMRIVQKVAPEVEADFTGVIVFVLHLPAFFTSQLVQALQKACKVPVVEAQNGVPVALKKIYIAPGGDKNLILARNPNGKGVMFQLIENDQMLPLTPSIDVFMKSAAGIFKDACRGVLISGTGTDGVEGLRVIGENRGESYVQDKASAIANQLPLAAWNAGVAKAMLDIPDIVELLKK